MFTGIVEGLGRVEAVKIIGTGFKIGIRPLFSLKDPIIGESISVDGVCLTLTSLEEGLLWMDVSQETATRSTLGVIRPQELVNLERALKIGDRLGGHFVLGHVDAIGIVKGVRKVERSHWISISTDPKLSIYMVEKGSITVNGVSLTINKVEGASFEVNIVPHTYEVTNLKYKQPGSKVNIEVDILGKYVYSILTKRTDHSLNRESGLTLKKLQEYGW